MSRRRPPIVFPEVNELRSSSNLRSLLVRTLLRSFPGRNQSNLEQFNASSAGWEQGIK